VGRSRWKGGARPREIVRSAEGQLGGSDSLVWASGEMMAGKRVCSRRPPVLQGVGSSDGLVFTSNCPADGLAIL
jgi:hypothetical protein